MSKYRWNLQDPGDYDLSVKRRGGYYDVVSGIDGWTVKTPHDCWSHDGRGWQQGAFAAPPRGLPGAVSRDQARVFAESLIAKHEG